MISVMLAKLRPNIKIIAVDISAEALDIAKINIEKFGVHKQIELRFGDALSVVDEEIDLLVSNPPYIANDEPLERNLDYEPAVALYGGKVGDEMVKDLIAEVDKRQIPIFTCEFGYDQALSVQNEVSHLDNYEVEIYKDYSDFDRGFIMRRV